MRRERPVLVAALGAADPIRLLLRDPALVLVAEPCAPHRARLELRLAALKCLGHRDYLELAVPRRRRQLLDRFRWLIPDESFRAWDGRVDLLAAAPVPGPDEFAAMKVRANRVEVVTRPLDRVLADLPAGFADQVFPASACGADASSVRAQAARVALAFA